VLLAATVTAPGCETIGSCDARTSTAPTRTMPLCGGARPLERPRDLARLLAEDAPSKDDRLALELGSPTLDQRRQLAGSGLVREAITALRGPLGEQGEVVILAYQVR